MDYLLSNESLFRDIEVFNPDYIPESFLYRDQQIKVLSLCIKPALKKGRPLNAVLIGPPATGKTTSIKSLFDQVPEKILCVYINCHLHRTQYNIFAEIHRKIFGYRPPDSGIAPSSLQEKIFSKLSKDKKPLLVALDDCSHLEQKDLDDVIYSVLRAYESYEVLSSVWLSSNKISFHTMEDSVRSILQPQLIQFSAYKKNEIEQILRSRILLGMSIELKEDLFNLILDNTRDIRHGIELIKTSALLAESDLKKEILKEHIEKAINNLEINDAGEFLKIIKESSPIESGELYEKVKLKIDISYSTFYRHVKKLERDGKIKMTQINKSSNNNHLGLQDSKTISKGKTTSIDVV